MMYVDESGDPGSAYGSTEYFILSGLILNYKCWYKKLELLKRMRKYFKIKYKIGLTVEIHAKELLRIGSIKSYRKISKAQRMRLLNEYAAFIPKLFNDCLIINVCLKKGEFTAGTDFQALAFGRLINAYNSFLTGTADEGIIIADESNEKSLRTLIRKLRVYNPLMSDQTGEMCNAKIDRVIEDIFFRKSDSSYFIQTADVIAYLLKNKEFPKGSGQKYNLDRLFSYLEPILFKQVSGADDYGIMRS